MAILDLYVNSFDATKDEWDENEGSSPYLDAVDYPENIISTHLRKAECGDFGFTDSGKTTETINSVYLYIYFESGSKYGITVFLWDGSTYHELTGWEYETVVEWHSEDVSAILNTWTKIDAAKIYVKKGNDNWGVWVDCAYLKVDYTPVPPVEIYPTFSLRGRGGDARRRLGFQRSLKLKKA